MLAAVLAPIFLAVVGGVFALWPGSQHPPVPASLLGPDNRPVSFVSATVRAARRGPCGENGSAGVPPAALPTTGPASIACLELDVHLTGGPNAGTDSHLEQSIDSALLTVRAGDQVRLGSAPDLEGKPSYYVADFQRGLPLALLAFVFGAVVVAVARWRGLAALAGLALTVATLRFFVLPALLEGRSPLGVALAGSAALLFVLLYLGHGLSVRTSTALVGTLASLALTGLLAGGTIAVTHLTGLGSDDDTALKTAAGQVSLTGLLAAGLIIGSLGVLNDVTVTQASSVWELAAASPKAKPPRLYRAGMRIGRDHIASAVYTVVFAYAGAALPSLLLFTLAGRSSYDTFTGELVAEEVVRTAVAGIGLVASVPITTALAAVLAASPGRGRPRPAREHPSEPTTVSGMDNGFHQPS